MIGVVGLNNKQKLFAENYLINLNATQAAVQAGYSEKSAGKQGHRLLQRPDVRAYLKKRQRERMLRCEISQDRVLMELMAIAFSSGTDYINVDEKGSVRVVPTEGLDERKRAAITGIKESSKGIEIKLADKVRALELLGKHLGMFGGTGEALQAEDDPLTASIEEAVRDGAFEEANGGSGVPDDKLYGADL